MRQSRFPGAARRPLRLSLTTVLLLALAGCAGELRQPPSLTHELPTHWRNEPESDSNLLGPAPDLRSWWRAFDDAGLDRLIERALHDNLGVAEAGLRVRAARELAWRSQAGFLPSLSVHTLATPNPTGTASYLQGGPDIAWELGLFGLGESSKVVADSDIGLAEADRQAARVALVAEVARVYVNLRAAQQRLALGERSVGLLQQKLALTQVRISNRLAASAELHRAEADLAQAQSALSEPRATIAGTQQQLALLLAQPEPDAEWSNPAPAPTLRDRRIAAAPADLLRTRPEIKRAEQLVLKSAGERGLARADLFPKIVLHGLLTYSFTEGGRRVGDNDGIISLGPTIDLPLFDWGQRRAALHAREFELEATVLGYRQAVLEGIAETESALALLENLRQRVAEEDRTVTALASGSASVQSAARLGLADGIAAADASLTLLQAELQRAQAQEAHNLAFITLYKALGGAPLPEPEATADAAP